ncbi:transposase [Sphingomonas sp. PWP1-2]|uniref:transposase n=1 Tax=Sphingomonas sp. PWP1-2 TaxID=2804558 RepID=UPI003CEA8C46
MADKGYDADTIRADLAHRNIQPVIPGRSNRRIKIEHDRSLYKKRNHIERFFGRLKINPAIAIRYDQLAESFLSIIPYRRRQELAQNNARSQTYTPVFSPEGNIYQIPRFGRLAEMEALLLANPTGIRCCANACLFA